MKRDVRRLIRAVLVMVDEDLVELRDSVVQADERAADAMHQAIDVSGRLDLLEQRIAAVETPVDNFSRSV